MTLTLSLGLLLLSPLTHEIPLLRHVEIGLLLFFMRLEREDVFSGRRARAHGVAEPLLEAEEAELDVLPRRLVADLVVDDVDAGREDVDVGVESKLPPCLLLPPFLFLCSGGYVLF